MPRCLCRPIGALACLALALAAGPVAAGLSIESMQERHHALSEADSSDEAPARTLLDIEAADQDGAPALVGSVLGGSSGLRIERQMLDGHETPFGFALRLGVVARDGAVPRLEGSALTLPLPLSLGELYASYEPRHWGPGWFGSLVLDESAYPVAAAGWRGEGRLGTPWRWRWDAFAGTLESHDRPQRPRLIGMRLSLHPSTAWSVGLSRTLQWGGEGRDESPRSLLRALIGRDNRGGDGITEGNEPGNQLAGVDVRYERPLGAARLAAYGQLIGEDEAGMLPSRNLSLFGADAALPLGAAKVRLVLEHADTTAGGHHGVAYRHRIYEAGYAQRGRLLGHPVGGDAKLISAAALLERGRWFAMAAVHRGRAQPGSQLYEPGDTLLGADVALTYSAAPELTLGAALQYWSAGQRSVDSARLWAELRAW
jgi:hypothetical protein